MRFQPKKHQTMFQSTPPGKVRPQVLYIKAIIIEFQSTPSEWQGDDDAGASCLNPLHVSIHAPLWRATGWTGAEIKECCKFQSTPSEWPGDEATLTNVSTRFVFSTTPRVGATSSQSLAPFEHGVSIQVPEGSDR